MASSKIDSEPILKWPHHPDVQSIIRDYSWFRIWQQIKKILNNNYDKSSINYFYFNQSDYSINENRHFAFSPFFIFAISSAENRSSLLRKWVSSLNQWKIQTFFPIIKIFEIRKNIMIKPKFYAGYSFRWRNFIFYIWRNTLINRKRNSKIIFFLEKSSNFSNGRSLETFLRLFRNKSINSSLLYPDNKNQNYVIMEAWTPKDFSNHTDFRSISFILPWFQFFFEFWYFWFESFFNFWFFYFQLFKIVFFLAIFCPTSWSWILSQIAIFCVFCLSVL